MSRENSCDRELLIAIEKSNEESNGDMVLQCLEHGVNVNAASKNGWTPLMLAVLCGSSAVVKLLLEHGADPNLTTQSEENPSRSALAVAVSNGRFELVQALVAHDVNIDRRDYSGLTPIELAEKLSRRPFHQEEIAAIALFLKEAKANLAQQTSIPVAA